MLNKVLVTGGCGYIGSHAVLALLDAGFDVVVLDNLSNSSINSLSRVESLTKKNVDFVKGDILDKSVLRAIFNDNKITSVMHFAGLKAVGESCQMPLKYYQNNVVGSMNLLDVMTEFKVFKLIFSSSATVYDENEKSPLVENSVLNAKNPYGRSKLMIENIISDLCDANDNWAVGVLRYFNPVGAHESGRIGEDPLGTPNNLVPYIMRVAQGIYNELSVFGGDYPTLDGTGIRDYIHVQDLVDGHIKALNVIQETTGAHFWNLGSGKGYSVLQMVKMVEQITGIEINYQITKRRPGDVAECCAEISKALSQLGWKPKRDLRQMISSSWKWQTMNPSGYSDEN